MAIRQQKREKPNTYAKTDNSSSVTWPGSKPTTLSSQKTSLGKKSVTPSFQQYLQRDLLRTAAASGIAAVILFVAWLWTR